MARTTCDAAIQGPALAAASASPGPRTRTRTRLGRRRRPRLLGRFLGALALRSSALSLALLILEDGAVVARVVVEEPVGLVVRLGLLH